MSGFDFPGHLLEGDLEKSDDGEFYVSVGDDRYLLSDVLEQYEGEEVRMTVIEIEDLAAMKEDMTS